MESTPERRPLSDEQAIECWDDDEDLQCGEDIRFRTVSTATSVTGFSAFQSGHRDSFSSRRSCKSDTGSNLDDDESWQLLLQDQENDDYSAKDAVDSARSAGFPIPGDIAKTALLGGTIKRLGGKKNQKAACDDWLDDVDLSEPQGKLELKTFRDTASPESLFKLTSLPTSTPPRKEDADLSLEFEGSPSPSRPVIDDLERFRDTDDDSSFLDVPTIKIAKSRPSTTPFVSHEPEPSRQDEGFEEDLEFPPQGEPLRLSARTEVLKTPDPFTDDFDAEWVEGSIGVRFGGTKREERSNRSSTASMLSPSLSSCLTAESEEDALEGLALPDEPLDLANSLQKNLRSKGSNEAAAPEQSPSSTKQPDTGNNDDLLSGIDFGDGDVFDPSKLTLNRNIKQKSDTPSSPARRGSTAITFTSKPTARTRIPRLSGHERPHSTHLEPVSESGAPVSNFSRRPARLIGHAPHSSLSNIPLPTPHNVSGFQTSGALGRRTSTDGLRSDPTTTNPQSVKAKRSIPAMRSGNQCSAAPPLQSSSPSRPEPGARSTQYARPKTPIDRSKMDIRGTITRRPQASFAPAGSPQNSPHYANVKSTKHSRGTDSEGSCDSSQMRSTSRLSNPKQPESPGHVGNGASPESLAATAKQSVTKPTRRRNFGDGTELDIFDDLPTSAPLESGFVKNPIKKGAPRSAWNRNSQPDLLSPRMDTPAPAPPPISPLKSDSTPRFARDTNASRNARAQRLGSMSFSQREREAVPLAPLSTNWRTQNVPRPLNSPSMTRSKPRKNSKDANKPHLIKPMGMGVHEAKSVKGMKYNPTLFKWEGNENAATAFDAPSASQNSKPALISNVGGSGSTQVIGDMVFDPQKLTWLKLSSPQSSRKGSIPISPEDDVFAGIQDLEDDSQKSARPSVGNDWVMDDAANADDKSGDDSSDEWPITEEFDVGPEFIRRQRVEEEKWRRKINKWVGEDRSKLGDGWRWAIRDLVRPDLAFSAHPRREAIHSLSFPMDGGISQQLREALKNNRVRTQELNQGAAQRLCKVREIYHLWAHLKYQKMGSVVLPHLHTAWHVDQAILSEESRLVVIRFGRDADPDCMRQDEILYRIADSVKNFAVIYLCDLDEVPDFQGMYELYDPMTIMFFFRNKHMMCDFGTGNNNKLNWALDDKQELIDIIEVIYRGAKKGRGLVVSPKDYSTRYRY